VIPVLEFSPQEKDAHATRAAIFPLDCSRSHLKQLFRRVFNKQSQANLESRVESIVRTALHSQKREAALTNPDISDPATFTVNATLAVLHLERADPFLAYPYSDSHTRYLETPLQQNPGLSQPAQHVREYYMRAVIGYTKANPVLAEEAATLLYALYNPPPDTTRSEEPITAYADCPLHRIFDARRNSVQLTDDTVRIPSNSATHRCRAPAGMLDAPQTTPPIQQDDYYAQIPIDGLQAKLARYAFNGFNRLVHIAFHSVYPAVIDTLKRKTAIDDRLRKKDETGHTAALYDPLYTVTGTHPNASGSHAPTVPDPRLVGIVDTIRATPTLGFNQYHTVDELATAARSYVPPPHRPSLPQLTPQKIRGVLSHAAAQYGDTTGQYTSAENPQYTDVVRKRQTDAGVEFLLRAPEPTPLYTPPADDIQHRWDAYKHLLSQQSTEPLPDDAAVSPLLDQYDPRQAPAISEAVTRTHTATATTPHTEPLTTVTPRVTAAQLSEEAASLTHDERIYLTRIGRGMQRLLSNTTLSDGMAHYDRDLEVDPADLVSRDWLNHHPEPRVTLYTLPRHRFRQLGLQPLRQEGYSDTVFEKSPHKYSAARLQAHLASQSSVDDTYRYLNLWRLPLESDTIASIIADSPVIGRGQDSYDDTTVINSRADVLGVATGLGTADMSVSHMHVGEALTMSNNESAPVGNWDKLAILGHLGATTHWIFPSGEHASTAIQKLCKQDRIAAPPTSLADDRTPKECHQFVTSHDPDNPGIDYIHGIRNLRSIT
jgi:hypothetical protein